MTMIHDRLLTLSKVNGRENAINHRMWALYCWDCRADSSCLKG